MSEQRCLNCDHIVEGNYCNQCGQRIKDNHDRSLKRLIGSFLGNLYFLDNRLVLSFRYLFLKPGAMSKEFLEGKRKKFLPPITLFLFVNLIYFFIFPLADYSLSLTDQKLQFGYGSLAQKMIEERLEERNIDSKTYAIRYKKMSDEISKTIMIVNVPMIALFTYLVSVRKYKFYYDSLIFALHFFTFFLISILFGFFLRKTIGLFAISPDVLFGNLIFGFIAIIPIVYLIIAYRNYLKTNWFRAALASLFTFFGLVITQGLYRALIFFLAFYTT